jgi:hypothetical protein
VVPFGRSTLGEKIRRGVFVVEVMEFISVPLGEFNFGSNSLFRAGLVEGHIDLVIEVVNLGFYGILVPEDRGWGKVLKEADKKGPVRFPINSFFSRRSWGDIHIKSNGYVVQVAGGVVYSPIGT